MTTGAGPVEVKAPRVEDRREAERYRSAILPVYMRKSPKVTEVLPLLYLRGLSTGDFAPALAQFLGSEGGLSASTVQRLTESWQSEHEGLCCRDLSGVDYVYWWVDGCISTSAWKRTGCAAWSLSASAPTAPRCWWRSATATGVHGALGRAPALAQRARPRGAGTGRG